MEPKRVDKGKQVRESSRTHKRVGSRSSDPNNIVFEDESQ